MMNDFFQENKKILFIMISALAVFVVVITVLIVRPLTLELKTEKENVTLALDEAKTLQIQLAGLSEDTTNIDIEQLLLEKKVPSEPKLDEYILSLQQLEQYANSAFENISFSYDSSLESIEDEDTEDQTDEEIIDDADNQLEENDNETTNNAESRIEESINEQLDAEQEKAPVFLTEIPDNLEVMTVTITALVPSFDELVNLVRAIENQDRISIVSHMRTVLQSEEEELFEEEKKLIALEIDVSTFYYAD